MATKFSSKTEAKAAVDALGIVCAGPVFVSAIDARVSGIAVGWYIGSSVTRKLIDVSTYEVAA